MKLKETSSQAPLDYEQHGAQSDHRNRNFRSPFAQGWQDPFGNSFEDLVSTVICMIVNSEPEPYRYDSDLFPPLVIREAVKRLESARGRKLQWPPAVGSGEDLVQIEIQLLLEVYGLSDHPAAIENTKTCRQQIRAIEGRYPGTLDRVEAAQPGTLTRCGLKTRSAAA